VPLPGAACAPGAAQLFAVCARLASEGVAFALVSVVRAVAPTSGKPGDKAVLTEHGEWLGWVGGSCAEPLARRAAQAALADGRCRLIHLTNDEMENVRSGVERAAMTCYSGGSLEIYVEPHLARPSLIVFGRSPIAQALLSLGGALAYRVTHVDLKPDMDDNATPASLHALEELAEPTPGSTFVVVASHGPFELEALHWALARDVAYVGLVSSQRRLPHVLGQLKARGLGAAALGRLNAPAGLPLGAVSPEEVALSVLSEIVAQRRGAQLGGRRALDAQPREPQAAAEDVTAALHEPAAPPREVAATAPAAAPVVAPRREVSCCESRSTPDALGARATQAGQASGDPPPEEEPSARVGERPSCCEPAAAPRRTPEPATAISVGAQTRSAAQRPTFSAVVLAAGLSRRMGAPNKLLLPIGAQPMIRHGLERLSHAGFAELVVVLGHQAREVGAAIGDLGVRTVLNAQFEQGQIGSVRAGLAALTEPSDAVMICLGDQPLLTSEDVQALMQAFAQRPFGSVLVPMRGERRGNPVVMDWQSARETLERGTHFGCRHFMAEHPERVYAWQASSDHFIRDVDEPADYQALLLQTGA
jgi:xanthine dehydrogenase accessory factor